MTIEPAAIKAINEATNLTYAPTGRVEVPTDSPLVLEKNGERLGRIFQDGDILKFQDERIVRPAIKSK